MNVSELISYVEDILTDYYSNTDTSTSNIIIGGNEINIKIVGNTGSKISAEQMTLIRSAIKLIGSFSLILNYGVKYRIYLAVLMGLTSPKGTVPEHFSAAYASKLFNGYNIYSVDKDSLNDSVIVSSSSFSSMTLDNIQAYIKSIIDEQDTGDNDYGTSEIYFNGEDSSSSSSSSSSIVIPLRVYYALISKYLIDYVEEHDANKIMYVVVYSIRIAASSISSSKMVNITINNNTGSIITLEQLSNLTTMNIFGVVLPELEVDSDSKTTVILCIIVSSLVLLIFGTASVFADVILIKHSKVKNFKKK